jgi:hypothetical protein
MAFAGKLLWNYFVLYGPQMFLSSLVVGGFMSWAFSLKILPHLVKLLPEQKTAAQMEAECRTAQAQQERQTADVVRRLADEDRSAAPVSEGAAEQLRTLLLADLTNAPLRRRYDVVTARAYLPLGPLGLYGS